MDTNMEDVSLPAELAPPLPTSEPATIPTLDGWIESLMSCKQLAEADVQRLCEKVCAQSTRPHVPIRNPVPKSIFATASRQLLTTLFNRREKSSQTSRTCNRWYVFPERCRSGRALQSWGVLTSHNNRNARSQYVVISTANSTT